jgi:predicted dehydrogenase/threonine dehydrogenase-like Zn-dependent dehydrogenase
VKSVIRDGRGLPYTADVPRPAARTGTVLVRTRASLVSAGTERAASEFASAPLLSKAARRPDLVRQVVDKVRRDGLWETQRAVRARLQIAESLGYSCAGIVEEDRTGEHPVGSLVACAGGGHAAHAEYNVVPRNLVTAVPPSVTAEHAAFAAVGSVALHGLRLADCGLGDHVVVIGLGLVGQLAVQLAKAAGCTTYGLDPVTGRTDLAAANGCDHVAPDAATLAGLVATHTHGCGADAVVIAASSKDSVPVTVATEVARSGARLVVVGDTRLDLDRRVLYEKELRLVVSRSYGPGRYDRSYEERGVDYPYEYVRWTLKRNLDAFLDLVPRLRIESLISHRFPLEQAGDAYTLLAGERREPYLGILLVASGDTETATSRIPLRAVAAGSAPDVVGVSVVGAGNFARATLLPALEQTAHIRRVSVVTGRGLSAWDAGRRFGFEACSADVSDAFGPETALVLLATRHSQHAALACEALGRGKAVFVEKPLCVNEEELLAVERAYAAAAGRPFLMVGYNRRFAPLVVRLRSWLAAVGRPLMLTYRVNAGPVAPGSWLLDAEEGGGRLVGEACHFVDLLMHLTGARPRMVHALRPQTDGSYSDAETFTAILQMSDGSVATLAYSADGDAAHPKERLEILGGRAVAVLDDFRTLTLVRDGRRRRVRTLSRDKGHAAELRATVDAVRAGATEPIPFDEAVAGMRATFAMQESLALGSPIALA